MIIVPAGEVPLRAKLTGRPIASPLLRKQILPILATVGACTRDGRHARQAHLPTSTSRSTSIWKQPHRKSRALFIEEIIVGDFIKAP